MAAAANSFRLKLSLIRELRATPSHLGHWAGTSSTFCFGLCFAFIGWARIGPWLDRLPLEEALFWLLLPHAFRHLGMVFLTPAVVDPGMPAGFALAAGYGDLSSGLLAFAALVALHFRLRVAIALAAVATAVGFADLAYALSHDEAIPFFRSAWYIPTFLVPFLLVTHVMTAKRLIGRVFGRGTAAA